MTMNAYQNSHIPGTDEQERILKSYLIHQALECGNSVARVVENIWAYNIHEADEDARQLIRLSNRYGAERLEAACERALYYRQPKNSSTIRWILEKGFDRLELSPHTDLRGQFVFTFETLISKGQNNVESSLMCEKSAD